MSNVTINPKWMAWQQGVNEGGEGYNPHQKWAPKTQAAPSHVAKTADSRMLRDERGNMIPAPKLAARLAADEARIASLTDASAIAIIAASIAHARQQLGA